MAVLKKECEQVMENQPSFLDRIFHLRENGTTVRTEILAGITTFMTMAYILAVNPTIMSAAGMDKGAVLTATALASLIGTFSTPSLPLRSYCRWAIPGKWPWQPSSLKGSFSSSCL